MKKNIYFSLIVPLYNEGLTLPKSIAKIYKQLEKLNKGWEVIFIEDKSTDDTRNVIKNLAQDLKNTKVIYHNPNQGRGQSVTDGIKAAKGTICGYLDVDLEVSDEYIPLFINEIENGADMAVGKRYYENKLSSLTRVLASRGYAIIVKSLLNLPITDTETGYKFFRTSKILPVLKKIKDKKWFWDTEICSRAYWAGLKIVEVPVLFRRRGDKKSTVKLIPDTWEYMQRILEFKSQVPKTERI